MLCIRYFDRESFLKQLAESRGSVYLHLNDGTVCDLKHDAKARALLSVLGAPAEGLRISTADPADAAGFLRYMLEAGLRAPRAAAV